MRGGIRGHRAPGAERRHGLPGTRLVGNDPGLAAVGQANGRVINLLITVADGQTLFGVGTLAEPLDVCRGPMGGPFVGPAEGDQGD